MFDRFYAGKYSYSIPFICALIVAVILITPPIAYAILWIVGETIEHFIP